VARELVSSTLKVARHDVFELTSGIGAVRALVELKIDAVVLDLMLPDLSGDKLARILREQPEGATLTIVLISGHPAEELRDPALTLYADAVVQKLEVHAKLARIIADVARRRSFAPPRSP
jgi:DNA-binding response OmpR family regulator